MKLVPCYEEKGELEKLEEYRAELIQDHRRFTLRINAIEQELSIVEQKIKEL